MQLTERRTPGDVIIFEQPDGFSRNFVRFAAGSGVLALGTIVARNTSTGRWGICVRGASNGMGVPAAVLLQTIAISAEIDALILDRGPAVVKTPALIWDASFATAAHIDDALAVLEQNAGIQRVDPKVAPAQGLRLAEALTLDLDGDVPLGVPIRIDILGVTAGSTISMQAGAVWPGTYLDPEEWVIEGVATDTDADFALQESNPAAVNSPVTTVFSFGATVTPPEVVSNPTISAPNTSVGSTISATSMGVYSPPADEIDYQWYVGAVPIEGASGTWSTGDAMPTHGTTADDELAMFRLVCTPSNAAGPGNEASSNPVGPFVVPKIIYFQQFFRSTVPSIDDYDESLWTYGTPNSHSSTSFPVLAAPYPSIGSGRPTSNSMSSNNRVPAVPPPTERERFSGTITPGNALTRWAVTGLPNHPVYGRNYRIEMGFGNVTASFTLANGMKLYDGAKGAGGDNFHTVPGGVTIPTGSAMDVLGGVYSYAAWDGARDKIDHTFLTDRFEFSADASSGNQLVNYLTITNQYTDIATSGAGPFYVDAVAGNDMADGLSEATAWKHAPGTPGAEGIVPSFVLLPGGEIRWKRGQTHRHPGYVGQTAFYSHILPGESGNPMKLAAYGSGADPVLSGAVMLTTGWTVANTGAASASAQGALGKVLKKTMTGRNRTNFFLYNGQQTYPAQWPHHPCLSNVESTDDQAGWFRISGYTIEWSETGDPDVPGFPYVMTITDSQLVARGTGSAADLVGKVLIYRQDQSNLLVETTVHFHNRAAGVIKVGFPARGPDDPDRKPFMDDNKLYCVRYSPFDLNYEYQFAWDDPFGIGEAYLALPATPNVALIEQSLLSVGIDALANYLRISPDIEVANYSLSDAVEASAASSPQAVRIGSGRVGVEIAA